MGIKNSVTEVLNQAIDWHNDGHAVDLITVVDTFGSSPRPVGSLAAVRHDGLMAGSVSGGCIEKQLVERMRRVNTITSGSANGNAARSKTTGNKTTNDPNNSDKAHSDNAIETKKNSVSYRINDDEAKRHGLLCGGQIELVFETITQSSQLVELQTRLANNVRTRRTLNLQTGAVELANADRNDQFKYTGHTLVNVIGPRCHLLIIGANELARFTAEFAMAVDFTVAVAEPRHEFRSSWPIANATVVDHMPDDAVKAISQHENCGVLALTHDPNLDDLALMEALELDLFYVGALGSKHSHEKRLHRLRGFDIPEDKLAQIQAPIGLSIGSRTSAEIAISIVGELIQQRANLPQQR